MTPRRVFGDVIFLKLGGSLITDKNRPRTVRSGVLRRIAAEIQDAWVEGFPVRLLIGHGSGSFGHVEAIRQKVSGRVRDLEGWRGYLAVRKAADELHRIILDALSDTGLLPVSFPPSTSAIREGGELTGLPVDAIRHALHAHLVPVVYGDVVFDQDYGVHIASTEEVFAALTPVLRPKRILLAGMEAGVYSDFPAGRYVLPEIRSSRWDRISAAVTGSAGADVTGGMFSKVDGMLELVRKTHGLRVFVFSGMEPGAVFRAILGRKTKGTWLVK